MLTRCRLCGSQDLKLCMTDGRNRDLNYYRCSRCSLWNYDISLGLDQAQYTEIHESPCNTESARNKSIAPSWDYLKKRLVQPGKLMDIGCGNGHLMYLARKDGWQVKGLELSADAARAIHDETGIEVAVANFLDYHADDRGSYDLVILRHVLEHLPDSILAMEKIGELLKPDGYAMLEFPNTASFGYSIKRFLKNRGLKNKKFTADWRPGHCNEFCRRSFSYLLGRTGFDLVDWHTYSSKPVANALYRIIPAGSKARTLVRRVVIA